MPSCGSREFTQPCCVLPCTRQQHTVLPLHALSLHARVVVISLFVAGGPGNSHGVPAPGRGIASLDSLGQACIDYLPKKCSVRDSTGSQPGTARVDAAYRCLSRFLYFSFSLPDYLKFTFLLEPSY